MLARGTSTLFFALMIAWIGLFHASSSAKAVEGYRLCALRKGVCSCQKIGDNPGEMTLMEKKLCLKEAASPLTTKKTVANTQKPAATKTSAKKAAISVEKNSDIPADKKTENKSSADLLKNFSSLFKGLGSSTKTTTETGENYRLCAVRKGICKCQKKGDGPGVLTIMEDASRCTTSPRATSPELIETAKPADKNTIRETQKLLAKVGYDPGPADGAMGPKTEHAIKAYQAKMGMPVNGTTSPFLNTSLKTSLSKTKATKKPRPIAVARRTTPAVKQKKLKARQTPGLASGSVKLRNCALRSSHCTCKTPEDGPKQWTIVATSHCKRTLFVNLWDKPATPIKTTRQTVKDVQLKLNSLGYDAGASDGGLGLKTTTAITQFQNAVGMPADGQITDILLQRLSDLAPDEVSEPIYANAPDLAPSTRSAPAKKDLTPASARAATRQTIADPAAAKKSPALSNPLAGLFGKFKADTNLPNSMDGYKNCALRKNKCLCQKLTDDAGVWTTMQHEVCTRRTGSTATGLAKPPTKEMIAKPKPKHVADTMVSKKTGTVPVSAPPQNKNKPSSSFLDSISKALTPQ